MPIAASAISHSTPPCSDPMGLAWRSETSISRVACPGSMAVSRKPMSAAAGGGGISPRAICSRRSRIFGTM